MRKRIVLLTDNIFLFKDYQRFGIKYLSENFKFDIFNVSNLTNPFFFKNLKQLSDRKYKNFSTIHNFNELNKILSDRNYHFAYDFMGINWNCWKIRQILKIKKILLIKNFSKDASIPQKKTSTFLRRFYDNFITRKQLGGSLLRKFKNRIILKLYKNFQWDIGVFFGDEAFSKDNKVKSKNYIKSHTFDFDNYLKLKNKKKNITKNYFVFIDNDLANHPDYKYHGTKPPVDEKKYLTDLKNFFDLVEKKTKLKVVIAANPKSKHKIGKFGNRKILFNKTGELIKSSIGVFIHNSTAINYAILFKKPLFFLSSNHIKESWLHEGIYLMSKTLGRNIINMNMFKKTNILNFKINYKAYEKFKNKYIKCTKTKNIYSLVILNENLKKF